MACGVDTAALAYSVSDADLADVLEYALDSLLVGVHREILSLFHWLRETVSGLERKKRVSSKTSPVLRARPLAWASSGFACVQM